jgi:hypothetical protein
MSTARCVASHTVPNNSTTPSRSSAAIAPIRATGDSIEVTYSVACTRISMALNVIATIINVVSIDRKTRLIGKETPRQWPCNRPRARQWGVYRNPDQSSATRIESLGLDGSYFTLACWPLTSPSNFTWLSRPVTSCAVW